MTAAAQAVNITGESKMDEQIETEPQAASHVPAWFWIAAVAALLFELLGCFMFSPVMFTAYAAAVINSSGGDRAPHRLRMAVGE